MSARTRSLCLILVIPFVLMFGMARAWTGDAVIHLRIAELFSQGHFFEFNRGEPVVATTSMLWTAILAALFSVLGPGGTAWAIKLLVIALWAATTIRVFDLTRAIAGSERAAVLAGGAFSFNPGVFQNSVGGMEAILLAWLLVMLYDRVFVRQDARASTVFALACAAALTRPEGMVAVAVAAFFAWRQGRPGGAIAALVSAVSIGGAIFVSVNYAVSGTWVPDSAFSRRAAGLRESVFIGPLHVHLKSIARLIVYAPLAVGLAAAVRHVERQTGWIVASLWLLAVMLFFYTFVIGATQTMRYWTPFFPFLVICSIHGLERARRLALAAVALAAIYGGECYLRYRLPSGFGYDHREVVDAVRDRGANTAILLEALGQPVERPIRLAVTEVQIRYFIEDNGTFQILSLDGRTSSNFRRFVDERTGLRRFDRLLTEIEPHFVRTGQVQPDEPVLYALGQTRVVGSEPVVVSGFTFVRTDPQRTYFRYLGREKPARIPTPPTGDR